MAKLRSALTNRNVRLLSLAFATTQLGDWLYNIVLLAYVYDRTHSAIWVGAASILRILPIVLFGAFGGVVADRFPRLRVMIVSDLVRAVLMFAIAVAAAMAAPVALIIGLVMVSTTAGTPHLPATTALMPKLVADEQLAAANSLINAIFYGALALGPAIGGLIAIIGSPAVAFAVNGATFAVSAAFTAAIRAPAETGQRSEAGAWSQLRDGFVAVRSSRDVLLLTSLVPAASFVPGTSFVLLVLVSQEALGTDAQGANFLYAALGVGAAAAAGVASRFADRPRPGTAFGVALGCMALPFAGLTLVHQPAPAYLLMAFSGAALMVMEAIHMTVLQRVLPPDVLGRVFGIIDTLVYAGILTGSLVATVLYRAFGLRAALLAMTGIVVTVAAATLPRLRALEGRLPQPNVTVTAAEGEVAPTVRGSS
jgi:predicted MFS family arabinose efflux permease